MTTMMTSVYKDAQGPLQQRASPCLLSIVMKMVDLEMYNFPTEHERFHMQNMDSL